MELRFVQLCKGHPELGMIHTEVGVCTLQCQEHTTTPDGECNENYCAECVDPHICGDQNVQ